MIGVWAMWAWAAAVSFLVVRGWQAYVWHHRGAGERQAHASYARIRRERPDIAEARLTEAEFVRYYVAAHADVAPYVVAVLLLVLIGLPVACWLLAGWSWE